MAQEKHEGELQHRKALLVPTLYILFFIALPFFCAAPQFYWASGKRVLLKTQWRKENVIHKLSVIMHEIASCCHRQPWTLLKTMALVSFCRWWETAMEESHLFPDSVFVQICLNNRQRSNSCSWIAVELIRSAGDEDGQYDKLLESKTNKEDLVAIFDSLNFLGGCAWRTNKRILGIAVHLFNNGGYEDLAIPGPVVQPEVDSIALKWASFLNSKDQFS